MLYGKPSVPGERCGINAAKIGGELRFARHGNANHRFQEARWKRRIRMLIKKSEAKQAHFGASRQFATVDRQGEPCLKYGTPAGSDLKTPPTASADGLDQPPCLKAPQGRIDAARTTREYAKRRSLEEPTKNIAPAGLSADFTEQGVRERSHKLG